MCLRSSLRSVISFPDHSSCRCNAVRARTGHEYQGRSTAADALLLWMQGPRTVVINKAYVACPGDAPGPAVVVSSGANWGDVYTAVAPYYDVVGGSSRTGAHRAVASFSRMYGATCLNR